MVRPLAWAGPAPTRLGSADRDILDYRPGVRSDKAGINNENTDESVSWSLGQGR
jgi:hypothetical protein